MRGDDEEQASVWSYIPLEQRIPADHPLRAMRTMVDEVLRALSPQFSRLYAKVGRPSIAPEWWPRPASAGCFRTSISPSTARSSRRGRA